MTRETLLDFFDDRIQSESTFVVYHDGYRAHSYTYQDIHRAAMIFSERLRSNGCHPADKVILWGENSAEWIAVFWGCLLANTVVVPLDFRISANFFAKVVDIVSARVIVCGNELPEIPITSTAALWRFNEIFDQSKDTDRTDYKSNHAANDLAQIIFTSGATSEPKGVEITHANILANIVPIEREVQKYQTIARPFLPLRFLNLLPLSHMFGQAMATFVPPMLKGITVFMQGYNPTDIVAQIKTNRVSVLVCVPKILEVLRDFVIHFDPTAADTTKRPPNVAIRWWRYRKIHRLFGFKFWTFVVGGAPLDPDLEAFWSRLGFLVIQGYGLTETAPIVTLNHPLRARKGSVGTAIGGVDLSIADDGEILVRGANVTRGYYNSPEATARVFRDGWFHTGDIGSIDEKGRLSVRGRKKEMIVTADGRNVFPEDIEKVMGALEGVREVAVVGVSKEEKERVHAILVLEPGYQSGPVVRKANKELEDHQRIRSCSVWPSTSLPRTEGTGKVKRHELKRWIDGDLSERPAENTPTTNLDAVLEQFAHGQPITNNTTIEQLGLSSLERIELMMTLEHEFNHPIDEIEFAEVNTISELRKLVTNLETTDSIKTSIISPRSTSIEFPAWNRNRLTTLVRRIALSTVLLPLTRLFVWLRIEGLDRLEETKGPVIYAANHQSHLDAPVILAALPNSRRNKVATAAALEWFSAHFHPERYSRIARLRNGVSYALAVLCFNVVPLPTKEAGARDAIRYLGELLTDGTSVLIFPEGLRTTTGEIASFKSGIGMIASKLRVPVIPVRITGVDRILHHSWRMARPGRARVAFGSPLTFHGNDYRNHARRIEESVKAL